MLLVGDGPSSGLWRCHATCECLTRYVRIVCRKAQAEADEQELNGLEEALESSPAEGVEFATDRLHNAETTVKDQFKEVFQELRDALEVRDCVPDV